MIIRLSITLFMIALTLPAKANDKIRLSFEIKQDQTIVTRGFTYISAKKKTWSSGLQTSYLKLTCRSDKSGRVEKLFSTVSYFAGVKVIHQIVENKAQLSIVRTMVKPRLAEIRALKKAESKELHPIVTTTSESYQLSISATSKEHLPFGSDMIIGFNITNFENL